MLKQWLRGPQYEDEEQTRLAQLLHQSLIVLTAFFGIYIPILALKVTPEKFYSALIGNGFLFVVFLVLLRFVNRGHVKLASLSLISLGWINLVVQSWQFGGIRDSSFTAFMIVIIASALLLGKWYCLCLTGLTILYGFFLAHAEETGLLPRHLDSAYSLWADQSFNFIITAAITLLVAESLRKSLKRTHQHEKTLVAKNQELQLIQSSLENKVQERTEKLAQQNERLQQEIAERQKIEIALREREAHYRALFEQSPVALWEADFSPLQDILANDVSPETDAAELESLIAQKIKKATLLDVNEAGMALYRTDQKGSLLGRLENLFDIDALQVFKQIFILGLQGRKNIQEEITLTLLDGRTRYALLNLTILPQDKHRYTRGIICLLDNSQRKLAEIAIGEANDELAKLNLDKDRFFSIVAHDLKGPFMPLMGLAEYLQTASDDLSVAEVREISGSIHRSATNIYALLENLLTWARLQQGAMVHQPTLFVLHTIVNQTVELLQNNAELKRIQLNNSVSPELQIYADINLIDTVIRNLVNNALKFTPSQGSVIVDAHQEKGMVTVSVRDTGVGISPENQAKLFQLDKPHTTKGTEAEQGTGLGLILCREMVEKNGGKIWLESVVNEGTTVSFTVQHASLQAEVDFP